MGEAEAQTLDFRRASSPGRQSGVQSGAPEPGAGAGKGRLLRKEAGAWECRAAKEGGN